MKKLMMMAAFALLTAGAQAQTQSKPKHTPEERAKMQTERMVKDLGLSPDQATRLEALNLKYAQQAEVMRKEHQAQQGGTHGKDNGQGKAMREAREGDMKALLTPEQYEKWLAQREAMREKHKEKQKEMRGDQKH